MAQYRDGSVVQSKLSFVGRLCRDTGERKEDDKGTRARVKPVTHTHTHIYTVALFDSGSAGRLTMKCRKPERDGERGLFIERMVDWRETPHQQNCLPANGRSERLFSACFGLKPSNYAALSYNIVL